VGRHPPAARRLAQVAVALPELRVADGPALRLDELRSRAVAGARDRATEFADLARVGALEIPGEGERAVRIIARRLRAAV
jgi:hypothetical protein